MNDINQVTLIGRLIREPEVRFAGTGTAVSTFSLAANQRYQDKSGQWKEEVAFISCISFGRSAEQLAKKHKGEPLLVTGRLRTETWTKDGENHSRLVLVAETAHFIEIGPKSSEPQTNGRQDVEKLVPF